MGKTTITFRLETGKRVRLDAIAATSGRDRSDVLNEAIDAYLDTYRWQVEHIKKGLKQAKSGRFASARKVARALKGKASHPRRASSKRAGETVGQSMAENAEDLRAFHERAAEPDLPFEAVLERLRRRSNFPRLIAGSSRSKTARPRR